MSALTIKQLEALYWIVELGSFERAAMKLNTSQSAISKRIRELEAIVNQELFDRSKRTAVLTPVGERVLSTAVQVLDIELDILNIGTSTTIPINRLRLGITELTAMTWFPLFVQEAKARFPHLSIEPQVQASRLLMSQLEDGKVDMVVAPDVFSNGELQVVRLGELSNVWMAKPGLVDLDHVRTLDDLTRYRVLVQGGESGLGISYNRFLRMNGVVFPHIMTADNLVALLGLTVAGLGVSYLPRHCFRGLISQQKLEMIPVQPMLPPVAYSAFYHGERIGGFLTQIADMMCDLCDFRVALQT